MAAVLDQTPPDNVTELHGYTIVRFVDRGGIRERSEEATPWTFFERWGGNGVLSAVDIFPITS